MTHLLRLSLPQLFRIGMVDFYVFLILGVALILRVPGRFIGPLSILVAITFALSACLTLSGMLLNHLYHEPEPYSILALQLAFTAISLFLI